ncbi:SDR family NAD(P)-dependent oxidoreductase (plasmid) [Novosphingobium sp. BL-8A]|uniref:SDR family NAD(P)-dependent oxidoreductase n=1 Tax=Novosphingobium sp. BL-8A TaxID=3127639 RepID=UPI0037576DEE
MREDTKRAALAFGGSPGIGAATVARFAKDGYKVVFTYASREDKAHQMVSAVASAAGEAMAIKADSSDPCQILFAVEQATETFDRIDALAVNAGDAVSVDQFDQTLNLRGLFLAIEAAAAHVNDGGRAITVAGNVAIRSGMASTSIYQSTKAAAGLW